MVEGQGLGFGEFGFWVLGCHGVCVYGEAGCRALQHLVEAFCGVKQLVLGDGVLGQMLGPVEATSS